MSEKTLTRTIGEGTLWFSISTWLLKPVGLLTTFITLRALSVYEYGLVVLALSLTSLLGVFLLPGLTDVVIADIGVERGQEKRGVMKRIFRDFMALQWVLGVCAWAILFFGADIIAAFYASQISLLVKIVSFMFLLAPIRTAYGILFSVYFKFFIHSTYSFLEEAGKLAFVVLFLFTVGVTPASVILGAILGQVAALFFLIPHAYTAYKDFSGAVADKPLSLKRLLAEHGKWSVFSKYVGQFGAKSRFWIIKFMLNTEAVAFASVAESLVGHTASLLPLSRVMRPIIPQYVSDTGRMFLLINKSIKYQLVSFALISIIAFTVFPPLIIWFFPHYQTSLPLFKVMLFSLTFTSVATMFGPVFFALKAQQNLFFAVLLRTIVALVLLPISILAFGTMGIAYEFVITSIVYTFERYRVLKRLLPGFHIRLRDMIQLDEVDRIIVGKVAASIKSRFPFQKTS